MAAGAILEIHERAYLSQFFIKCTKFDIPIDMGNASITVSPKYHFLKVQDGGDRRFRKYTKGRISADSRPICTKFGTLTAMCHRKVVGSHNWQYFWKFKMGRPPS